MYVYIYVLYTHLYICMYISKDVNENLFNSLLSSFLFINIVENINVLMEMVTSNKTPSNKFNDKPQLMKVELLEIKKKHSIQKMIVKESQKQIDPHVKRKPKFYINEPIL